MESTGHASNPLEENIDRLMIHHGSGAFDTAVVDNFAMSSTDVNDNSLNLRKRQRSSEDNYGNYEPMSSFPTSMPFIPNHQSSTSTSSTTAMLGSTDTSTSRLMNTLHDNTESEQQNNTVAPFTMTEHKKLVSAIFDIGVKESSPLSVMDHMSKRSKVMYEGLNLEKIKSKLQKYRKKKDKSKTEFMDLYDETITEFCNIFPCVNVNKEKLQHHQRHQHQHQQRMLPPIESLASSEIAAYLTYAVMSDKPIENHRSSHQFSDTVIKPSPMEIQPIHHKQGGQNQASFDNAVGFEMSTRAVTGAAAAAAEGAAKGQEGGKLTLPQLTEDEKNSSIGKAFASFIQLFQCIEKELYDNRKSENGDNPRALNHSPFNYLQENQDVDQSHRH